MLEPVVRPRAGMALLALGAAACVLLAFWDESVTTQAGSVSLHVLMPGFAAVFLVRLAGVAAALRDGRASMSWNFRVASWGVGLGNAWLFGMVSTLPSMLVAGGLVGLDAVAGTLARDESAPATPRRRLPSGALLLVAGVALLVGLHVFAVSRWSWWPLFDWAAAVLLATIALRVSLGSAGPAKDVDARPPPAHRVHERAERTLEDPGRRAAEEAVGRFREGGDAGALAAFAAETARLARLPDTAVAEVAARVPAMAARAGTTRDEDLEAAVAVLERALEDRGRTLKIGARDPA